MNEQQTIGELEKRRKKIIHQRWYYKNRERILQEEREDYYKNIDYEKERKRIYNQKPETKIKNRLYMRLRRKTSKVQKATDKKFNKYEYTKKWRKRYVKLKKINNPNFAIRVRLGCRIRDALNKNIKEEKVIIPKKYKINYNKIIDYLKPFPENIKDYEIDHIIPLCSFDLTDEDQFKKATAPENHQWLTISENRIKSGKISNQLNNIGG